MLVYKLKKNRTSTTPLSRVYTNRYIMSLVYILLYCTLNTKKILKIQGDLNSGLIIIEPQELELLIVDQ